MTTVTNTTSAVDSGVAYINSLAADDIINGLNSSSNLGSVQAQQFNTSQILGGYINGPGYGSGCSYFDCSEKETAPSYVEFQLTSGDRVLVNVHRTTFTNIREHQIKNVKFTWRYPFVKTTSKTVTSVFMSGGTVTEGRYTIDCNIETFMKIIGKSYSSWSEKLMEISVKNGIDPNN